MYGIGDIMTDNDMATLGLVAIVGVVGVVGLVVLLSGGNKAVPVTTTDSDAVTQSSSSTSDMPENPKDIANSDTENTAGQAVSDPNSCSMGQSGCGGGFCCWCQPDTKTWECTDIQ